MMLQPIQRRQRLQTSKVATVPTPFVSHCRTYHSRRRVNTHDLIVIKTSANGSHSADVTLGPKKKLMALTAEFQNQEEFAIYVVLFCTGSSKKAHHSIFLVYDGKQIPLLHLQSIYILSLSPNEKEF